MSNVNNLEVFVGPLTSPDNVQEMHNFNLIQKVARFAVKGFIT